MMKPPMIPMMTLRDENGDTSRSGKAPPPYRSQNESIEFNESSPDDP
jgi:hypothetical protein